VSGGDADFPQVTWEVYDKHLKDIGVLTKARNFLVFQVRASAAPFAAPRHTVSQGDVESVASKSPKELTALLEQISGSEDFKEEYDELKQRKESAEENTIFSFQKKKGYAAEKKQVPAPKSSRRRTLPCDNPCCCQIREQKEEAELFEAKQKQLSDIKCQYYLYQLFHIHQVRSNPSPQQAVTPPPPVQNIQEHQEAIDTIEDQRNAVESRLLAVDAKLTAAKGKLAEKHRACATIDKVVGRRPRGVGVLTNAPRRMHGRSRRSWKLPSQLG
jgi:structural maintenance of chromosome 1